MPVLGRLPIEILRKRYARMHQMLQAAGLYRVKLEERIAMLEFENEILKEERERYADAVR